MKFANTVFLEKNEMLTLANLAGEQSMSDYMADVLIRHIENKEDQQYNAGLEFAAAWITGAQLMSHSEEVRNFAHNMAMSIRAAKYGLTPRALDGATVCRQVNHFYVDGVCAECGSVEPPRQ